MLAVEEQPATRSHWHTRVADAVEVRAKDLFRPYEEWVSQDEFRRFGDPGCPLNPWFRGAHGVQIGFEFDDYMQSYEAKVQSAARSAASRMDAEDLPDPKHVARSDRLWPTINGAAEALVRVWALQLDKKREAEFKAKEEAERREADRMNLRRKARLDRAWVERQQRTIEKAREAEERLAQLQRDILAHRRAEEARKQLRDAYYEARFSAERLRSEFKERVYEPRMPEFKEAPEEAKAFAEEHLWRPVPTKAR